MQQYYPQISSRAFEHPADRAALSTLRKVRGFDLVLQKIMGLIGEKRLRLMFLASAIRVGPEQKAEVHKLLVDVSKQLDLSDVPELYISYSTQMNAMAIGMDRPFIVLHSALVERLSQDELRYVIAHEAGHILAGHSLYRTLLFILLSLTNRLLGVPRILFMPILLGLLEWSRKAELTADRAGLLAVGDLKVAQKVILKLCGASDNDSFNIETFEKQADEYENAGDLLDNVYKVLNVLFATHPFPAVRLKEIHRFADSKEYQDTLNGEYPKRRPEDRQFLTEDMKAAKAHYADSVGDLKESFSESLSNFWSDVEEKSSGVVGVLFNGKKNKSG